MEEPKNIIIEETNILLENSPEPKNDKKLSTPHAILLSAFLIVLAIFITNNDGLKKAENKTLSEKVGVSKEKLNVCIAESEAKIEDIMQSISLSIEKAVPEKKRGTPYSIVINQNGLKTDIQGAKDYAEVKKTIDDLINDKITDKYEGNVVLSEPMDRVKGNPNAKITVIEYSDFECPYCKFFHPTMEKIVKDYDGQVKWVYRQFPAHQHSVEKLIAADCVGKIKGDDAYFKYSHLLFGLLKTGNDSVRDQL